MCPVNSKFLMPQMGLGIEQSASIIELSLELTFLWEECGGGVPCVGTGRKQGSLVPSNHPSLFPESFLCQRFSDPHGK